MWVLTPYEEIVKIHDSIRRVKNEIHYYNEGKWILLGTFRNQNDAIKIFKDIFEHLKLGTHTYTMKKE